MHKTDKRALILHGTDASPDANWFPWIKQQLELRGYDVWIPNLPNNHTPNYVDYNNMIFKSGWDLQNSLIIGHSSGAVSILNLLSDERTPKIDTGILIGAWHTCSEPWTPPNQFINLFPKEGFDFKKIKSKAKKLVFVHGDNDPYCPLEQAQWLADKLDSKIYVIKNGHHLGSKFKKLPKILEVLYEI